MCNSIAGRPLGIEKIWIIGDEFCANFAHVFMVNQNHKDSYIKTNYEVDMFYSRDFSNNDRKFNKNVIARIHNTIVSTMMRRATLPKLIVIPIENDIIKFCNYNDFGVSEMYGKVMDYLSSEIKKSIEHFKDKHMPTKAKRHSWPQIIWIMPTCHDNYPDNTLRRKFGAELGAVIHRKDGSIALKLKQVWNEKNPQLVNEDNGMITPTGVKLFWIALDRTVKFADQKLFQTAIVPPTSRAKAVNCRYSRF